MNVSLPPLDSPVWLHEPGRGIWIGARADMGDGWLWGNPYGSHFYAESTSGKGTWRFAENQVDEDYRPTSWAPLPTAPCAASPEDSA